MFEKTEMALMPTFRCNARCQMCHIWEYPSKTEEEITLEDIKRLPRGFARINVGGGEPTLRKDIEQIVDAVSTKTDHYEMSTNGYFTDKLLAIAKKHPRMGFRVSLEGLSRKNDEIRGIKDGFDHALRSVIELRRMGIKNVGFSMTLSHRNIDELIDLYTLASLMDVEFTQCIVHDAWQFRIPNNVIQDKDRVAEGIKEFIRELLRSRRKSKYLRVKDWYRAYLNRGFLNFLGSDKRLLPCGAGSDIFFIDPDGDVYPCNAMKESMGNIKKQDFAEIWKSKRAQEVRKMVSECKCNCWMTGTARPAMKKNILTPVVWVIHNKIRLYSGKDIFSEHDNRAAS